MPYYAQGDYYQGDYYQGDPGIFGFLKKAVKGVARVGFGALTGGPGGAIGAAAKVASENIAMETLAAGPAITPMEDLSRQRVLHQAAIAKHSQLMVPMGGGMIPMVGGGGGGGGMRLAGWHYNKSTYVVRGGGTSHYPVGLNVVAKGTSLVRNRVMNWGNGRALGRAERRISAFLKHATRYYKWAHPHATGHAAPKLGYKKRKALHA
jgi:hypothetical protein